MTVSAAYSQELSNRDKACCCQLRSVGRTSFDSQFVVNNPSDQQRSWVVVSPVSLREKRKVEHRLEKRDAGGQHKCEAICDPGVVL